MLLKSLELMVCVTGATQLGMMVLYWQIPALAHETFNSLYFVFLEATGFATCLLSITRCLSLYVPFYKVNRHFVTLSGVIFVGYTLIREIALVRLVNRETYLRKGLLKIHIGLLLGEIGLMIVVVLVANTVSVLKLLLQPDMVKRSRTRTAGVHATVTVVILSGFFCFLNAFYLVTEILYFYYSVTFNENIVLYFGIFYAVPLNSCSNPLIYLLRKREMRQFLGALLGLSEPPEERRYSVRTRTLSLVAVTSMSIRSSNRSPCSIGPVRRISQLDSSPRLRGVVDETIIMNGHNGTNPYVKRQISAPPQCHYATAAIQLSTSPPK